MTQTGRPLTLWGMSCRNLYRQPLRTVLTAMGVSVGVVAIVAFGTMARGFWESTNAAIRFGGGDMIVFQAGVAADIFSTLDQEETEAALLANPDVEWAAPFLFHVMPAPKLRFGIVLGLRREDMEEQGERLIRGRNPQTDDEVLIGKTATWLLDKDVGDEIRLADSELRIVGVYETNVVYFNSAIVMTLPRLQEILGRQGKVSSFQVKVRPGADPAAVVEQIERENPKLVAIASAEQYHKVDEGLEIANAMVGAVSFLALVIGAVIVANTMWMTVHERTREIGVLRAVGWCRRKIVAMIIIESAGVAVIACVVGCLLGAALAEVTTHLPVTAQFVDPVYDWHSFGRAFAVAMVLGVLGGALPAWRAARISPVVALRCE